MAADPLLPSYEAEIRRLRAALAFYADEANWDSKVIRTAKDSEGYITGQECESGPAWDRGARARAALIDGSGGA